MDLEMLLRQLAEGEISPQEFIWRRKYRQLHRTARIVARLSGGALTEPQVFSLERGRKDVKAVEPEEVVGLALGLGVEPAEFVEALVSYYRLEPLQQDGRSNVVSYCGAGVRTTQDLTQSLARVRAGSLSIAEFVRQRRIELGFKNPGILARQSRFQLKVSMVALIEEHGDVSRLSVAEGYLLAEALQLDPETFWEVTQVVAARERAEVASQRPHIPFVANRKVEAEETENLLPVAPFHVTNYHHTAVVDLAGGLTALAAQWREFLDKLMPVLQVDTRSELAGYLGITPLDVEAIWRGSMPHPAQRQRIAEALDVEADDLPPLAYLSHAVGEVKRAIARAQNGNDRSARSVELREVADDIVRCALHDIREFSRMPQEWGRPFLEGIQLIFDADGDKALASRLGLNILTIRGMRDGGVVREGTRDKMSRSLGVSKHLLPPVALVEQSLAAISQANDVRRGVCATALRRA